MRGGKPVQEQETQLRRARVGARDARRDVEGKCRGRRLEEKIKRAKHCCCVLRNEKEPKGTVDNRVQLLHPTPEPPLHGWANDQMYTQTYKELVQASR